MSHDVTPEFLAECERLDAAATPGPWTSNYDDAYEDDGETEVAVGWPDTRRMINCGEYTMMRAEDSDFCVHARRAVPALVAEVRALRSRAAHRALWRDAERQQQRAEAAESRAADLERQLAHEQTLGRECYADAVGWLEQVDRILVACGLEPCAGASDERGKVELADAILSVLAHEQTLRKQAEERVAELEGLIAEQEVRRRLFHAQTQLAEADNLAEAVASIVAGDVHRTFCQGSCEICRTLAAFREVRRA